MVAIKVLLLKRQSKADLQVYRLCIQLIEEKFVDCTMSQIGEFKVHSSAYRYERICCIQMLFFVQVMDDRRENKVDIYREYTLDEAIEVASEFMSEKKTTKIQFKICSIQNS